MSKAELREREDQEVLAQLIPTGSLHRQILAELVGHCGWDDGDSGRLDAALRRLRKSGKARYMGGFIGWIRQ
jgi:hypothetical protein